MSDISKHLQKLKSLNDHDNIITNIYIGNFTDMYGSCNLDPNTFNKIEQKLKTICKFNGKKLLTVYSLNDKKLIIDTINKQKIYVKEEPIHSSINKKFVIHSFKRKYIQYEEFPLIDKYHNIEEQRINEYCYNSTIISCIKQNNNNTIKIEFNNCNYNNNIIYILGEIV